MNIPINQSDKFSRIPEKKYVGSAWPKYPEAIDQIHIPTNEPTTNAFSKATFEGVEEIILPETVKELNVTYPTLIALSAILIIIGATLATAAMFAIYGPAIELGNMKFEANELREYMEWKTGQIKSDVADLGNKKLDYVKMIDKIAEKTVSDLKPREAKIVNQ